MSEARFLSGYCSAHMHGGPPDCVVCWIDHDHSRLPTNRQAGYPEYAPEAADSKIVCPLCFPRLYGPFDEAVFRAVLRGLPERRSNRRMVEP